MKKILAAVIGLGLVAWAHAQQSTIGGGGGGGSATNVVLRASTTINVVTNDTGDWTPSVNTNKVVMSTNGYGTNLTFYQITNKFTSALPVPWWLDQGGPSALGGGTTLIEDMWSSNVTILQTDHKAGETVLYWGGAGNDAMSLRVSGPANGNTNARITFAFLNGGDELDRTYSMHTNDLQLKWSGAHQNFLWRDDYTDGSIRYGGSNSLTTLSGSNIVLNPGVSPDGTNAVTIWADGSTVFSGGVYGNNQTNSGTIQANLFVGNGAGLTGLSGVYTTATNSGNSSYSLISVSNTPTLGIKSLSQGANMTLTDQGTNIVIASSGGVGGSASNAIASVSTNGVLIGSGVLTNLDLTNGANILISGSPNTGTGIVTIAVSSTPTFSSITTTGTGPNILYGDQYQSNALIVTTGSLIWSNATGSGGITNKGGNTTNSGTIAAVRFVGSGSNLTDVTSALSGDAITNNETRTFNLAGQGVQVTGGGGYYGANSTNVEWMSAANATVGTKLYGVEAYFAGPVYMATGQWLSTSNISTGVLEVGGAAAFSSTLEATNATATFKQINNFTNVISTAPDFAKPYSSTNITTPITFSLPINQDNSKAETAVILIIGTNAPPLALTPPAGLSSTNGTWYVTNATTLTWYHYGNTITNCIAYPLY